MTWPDALIFSVLCLIWLAVWAILLSLRAIERLLQPPKIQVLSSHAPPRPPESRNPLVKVRT